MTQDKILADSLETSTPPRKPRIALMGEFSAGKSTLLNMLLAQATGGVRQPILKVSDYGLCRELEGNEYISRHTMTVPFRTAAPEVLQNQQFSLKSDV